MNPKTETELFDAISATGGPLTIKGGGTRGINLSGSLLCTRGLTGISLYEPGSLTMVAGAGTTLQEIETELAKENQCLAFEPMDHRGLLGSVGEPTIGGIVAANISGSRRIQAGACRDHLLGVRFVDGMGNVIRNGGRVMKNVTGYDLVKLLAGSWGVLGVLSEVSLKVLPKAETEETLLIRMRGAADAVEAMAAALGSPFEVTGAAFGAVNDEHPALMIRVEGFAASVTYRANRLKKLLGRFGEIAQTSGTDSAELWKDVRDVKPFHDRPGDVWRISVKPTDAPALSDRLNGNDVLFDWGGGLIWALVPAGTDLRALTGRFDGHATLIRASAQDKARLGMFHPQPEALERISAGLRARFDPRGVLNTGLMQAPKTIGA